MSDKVNVLLPPDARARIDGSYTDFTLCKACAGEVLDFVQGRAVKE